MTMILPIASHTAENIATGPDRAEHLRGWLEALARPQIMLIRQADAGVDLETMPCDQLVAQASDVDHVILAGRAVSLSVKAAEGLAVWRVGRKVLSRHRGDSVVQTYAGSAQASPGIPP